MGQPSPWILFMGGLALLQVSMLAGGLPAPPWVRYAAMAGCIGLGVTSLGLGLQRQFAKKPEKRRFVPRRERGEREKPARARDPEFNAKAQGRRKDAKR